MSVAGKDSRSAGRTALKHSEFSQDELEYFKSLFNGRQDAHGADGGRCNHKSVTDNVIRSHLGGERRIGIYPLSPDIMDGSGTWWVVADIDVDDLEIAIDCVSHLHQLGITGYIERSKSKGYHVWVFFSEPIQAREGQALMKYAINGGDCEIFPKQTIVRSKSEYGNFINLPLFGLDVKQGRTVFLDPARAYEPYQDQWGFLNSVKKVKPKTIADLVDMGELDTEGSASLSQHGETACGEGYPDMLPCVGAMMKGVSQGCRDEVAFALAKHFRVEKGLPQSATLGILLEWNRKNKPPLDDRTIRAKVKSAYEGRNGKGYTSFGCENPLLEPFCDRDSCPIFREHKKQTDQKNRQINSPYFRGNTFIPSRLADELMSGHSFIYTGQRLYLYSNGVYNKSRAEGFIRSECRKRLGEEARINRINEVLAHIIDMNMFDEGRINSHKDLINFNNGMLDWRTGELLDHKREYQSTVRIPITYNAMAECPAIDKFFRNTLPKDCIDTVEELFGYCLIPDARYNKAFMLKGPGRNGKSTFLKLLEAFVGSNNVSKVPLQDLCDHKFMRAEIFGKLVNVFADLNAQALRDTGFFKMITSGDPITAERKNQNPFDFRPFCKLVYSCNEIPRSPDRSIAYYHRWCIIEFPNQFIKGKNADENLIEKLIEPSELSGLLNRALNGLRRLFSNGYFTESENIVHTIEDYRKQNDTVLAFISDRCDLTSDGVIERKSLYDAYIQYCEDEGLKPGSRQTCYNRIRAQRVSERKINGILHFARIALKTQKLDPGQNPG